jgi:hypothetical protein
MDKKAELRKTIQRFRDEYLLTDAGQEHLAQARQERQDVQQVSGEIKTAYQRGEDITDMVLKQLLPHINSQFHRDNDYRISTWPCITRDVRGWFEGAGWKEPEDWQPTARLLFEAIDGFIQGDLDAWNAFLSSPYRVGFGTGFVSPILYCLDERWPVINSKVIRTIAYVTELLGQPRQIDAHLENYPDNAQTVNKTVAQLKTYGIDAYLEFDIMCHFLVSRRLSGILAPKKSKRNEEEGDTPDVETEESETVEVLEIEPIVQELQAAQTDSDNPARYEKAIAVAFSYLGFDATHIGGPGDADVLVEGRLGEQSYRAIIDGKTSKSGKVGETQVNWSTLEDHKSANEVEYVAVIAPSFTGQQILERARRYQVALLSTEMLVELLTEHAETPFSLLQLRALFEAEGLSEEGMRALKTAHIETKRRLQLMADIVIVYEDFNRQAAKPTALDESGVYYLLLGRYGNIRPLQREDLDEAIAILSSRLYGVLRPVERGYILTCSPQSVRNRVGRLADGLTVRLDSVPSKREK